MCNLSTLVAKMGLYPKILLYIYIIRVVLGDKF